MRKASAVRGSKAKMFPDREVENGVVGPNEDAGAFQMHMAQAGGV